MFETPRRLHPASIIVNFGAYFWATAKSMVAPLGAVLLSGIHSTAQYIAIIVGLAIALIGLLSLLGPVLHYFSTTFLIRDGALVISSGFVWRKHRTIPLARIQNVNVERTMWHRILGAAAVKVETAAGKKSEGDLSALSLADANALQAVLLQGREASDVASGVEKPAPLYQLSPKQVLLAGALGNRVMYVIGSIVAVFQFEGSRRFLEPFYQQLARWRPEVAALAALGVFCALFIIGWLLSIGISATRFFGFRIERHERGLLLTHGLITQFKTVVPVGRIQDVRIVQPIMYRLLGYCELYADTAGSFDKRDVASANKICPIIPEGGVSEIGKLLLPHFEFEGLKWSQVSPKTVGRHAGRVFFFYTLLLAFPLGFWLRWNALWFAIPLGIYALISGLVAYRYVGYSFTDDLIASRRGVLHKQAVVIPFDRIQHYTINSSLIQRWLKLASVSAISASSSGHPIFIMDIETDAAEKLRQSIGAAIRTHIGSRRGGL